MAPRKELRVFITGASSGLGKALALQYAAEGAIIGLAARQPGKLQALAESLNRPCAGYPLDVRDAPAMRWAAQDFIRRFGVPDIVIACAGVSCGNLTEREEDLEVFQGVLDINVTGMVKTFQPFVDPMRRAGRGALVGIASVAGLRGLPGSGAYSASKAAVISYLESLRVELRGSGLQVTAICPGYIDTPMTAANPYSMPFLLSAERAAAKVRRVIAARRPFAVIPWQMGIISFLLRHLPRRAYDLIFSRAPHKPRNLPV